MRVFMKKTGLVLAIVTVFALILTACGNGGEETEVTSTDDGFKQVVANEMTFMWKIDGDSIEIVLRSPLQGWVSVGFDPQTIMKGANMVMGYVDSDGEVVARDHFADQLTSHSADTELGGTDNVTIIGGEENENGTVLHVSIPLDSGDEYDTVLAEGETHKVMLASSGADDFTTQHPDDKKVVFEVEL